MLVFPHFVGGCMVLQGSRSVSDYQCSFVLVFSSVVQLIYMQFDLGWSAFQVHKNKLSSYVSNMLWQMVSKEV